MGDPVLSVVVPTRDRAGTLGRCLDSIERSAEAGGVKVEVVVGDDASGDGTADLLLGRDSVKVAVRERAGGSSAARNSALRLATAPLVLFTDDDIELDVDAIGRHLEFHSRNPDRLDALVGLVTWTRDAPITKHMEWLERGGPLFAFDTIDDPANVDPGHFCTANVSVKRELLDMVHGPFDERLPRFTDVELGLRLASQGMRLAYDRDCVAWHLRTDTPASTDSRMRTVGRASVLLDAIHPGAAPEAAPRSPLRRAKALAATALSPLAPMLPRPVADRIWSARAAWAYSEGRREAGA